LSSGRAFYPSDGVVSIAQDDDVTFNIGEGYDGRIDIENDEDRDWFLQAVMEKLEREEIASVNRKES
jgi:hypothetical protein